MPIWGAIVDPDSVGTAQLQAAAVTAAKIGNFAVETAKLNDSSVTSVKIGVKEVKTADIDDLAVDTAQIAAAAVTAAKLATDAVETVKILDGAVTSVKLDTNIAITGTLSAAAGAFAVAATGVPTQKSTALASWIHGFTEEEITLSTSSVTTDSAASLLPANSIIEAVTTRVTEALTGGGVTKYNVGSDTPTVARFVPDTTNIALNDGEVGLAHHQGGVATDALGPVQTLAAKIRITTDTATLITGKVRVTVFYQQFVKATS